MRTITRGLGRTPSRRRPTGVWGRSPQSFGVFNSFFLKNNPFLGIFWYKFLLKNTILFDCKVCCCTPKICAQGVCLNLPLPCYATAYYLLKHAVIVFDKFLMVAYQRQAGVKCKRMIKQEE